MLTLFFFSKMRLNLRFEIVARLKRETMRSSRVGADRIQPSCFWVWQPRQTLQKSRVQSQHHRTKWKMKQCSTEYIDVPQRLIFTALRWISRRPRSQNISKERALNPEKESSIKRPRSHVSSEKSSKNYKPLEYWAKPNLLPDVTPQPANSFGECIWRVCHVVKPEPREFLAILISQINWPRRGERAGWIAVWSSSLTGW